jgi:hypothetical protein
MARTLYPFLKSMTFLNSGILLYCGAAIAVPQHANRVRHRYRAAATINDQSRINVHSISSLG